jgi:hypothetical protein
VPRPHPRLQHSAVADPVWDDRAEQHARGLVALLFVAGGMRRTELSEALRLSSGRFDRACAVLNVSPPHGLALLESGDRIELVSAADCGPVIERFMNRPAPEPLSQAAMEVLSIVGYEQPITRTVKVGETPVEPCEHFPRMPSGCRERTIVSDCCV